MAGTYPSGFDANIVLVRVPAATGAEPDEYLPLTGGAGGAIAVVAGNNAVVTTITDVNATTAAEVSLASLNLNRSAIIIQNLDAVNAVRVGETGIAATRGIRLNFGESVTLETTAEIFGRGESSDVTVSVTEIEA